MLQVHAVEGHSAAEKHASQISKIPITILALPIIVVIRWEQTSSHE